jgi:hypothetical protein
MSLKLLQAPRHTTRTANQPTRICCCCCPLGSRRFSRHKHKEAKPDAEAGPVQKRRVIAFVGGLDLTDGRYDSPGHPLFGSIGPDGVHHQDFYQPCIDGEAQAHSMAGSQTVGCTGSAQLAPRCSPAQKAPPACILVSGGREPKSRPTN